LAVKLLEVIVSSLDEAIAAEDGGADRLELVRNLELEGLTPSLELTEKILSRVSIPVRTMVRDSVPFTLANLSELKTLEQRTAEFAALPIDGVVLGFIRDGRIDARTTRHLAESARRKSVTFHRAIESVDEPVAAIEELKTITLVDRILLNGGSGTWEQRLAILERLQRSAAPEIKLIVGGGLDVTALSLLSASDLLDEFHIGRAVRDEHGRIVSAKVASLKRILECSTAGTPAGN
jgi:copper homeostasis protein